MNRASNTLRSSDTAEGIIPASIGLIYRKAFSFPVFLGVLLAAASFVSTSWQGEVPGSKMIVEGDTWWHLAVGERILATGQWPRADSYSFTVAGTPWLAYEWMGEVVMALSERQAGFRGLAALLVGLSVTLILLVYYFAYLRSGNAKAAAVACALLLPLIGPFFTLRPQLLGYIFLVITLICLERSRRGSGWALWVLPVIFLLWVNTHATFMFGLLGLGLYWVCGLIGIRLGSVVAEPWTLQQRRQLAWVSLLCVMALAITPYGTHLVGYLLDLVLYQPLIFANNSEWYPLFMQGGIRAVVFLALALLFFLAQVLFEPPVYRLGEIALLLFAAYEGFLHARCVLFFALVFAPVLALLLARWIPSYDAAKDRPALNAILITLLTLGVVGFFPSDRELQRLVSRQYPSKALGFLRQHPEIGRMFNEYEWGGYLVWSGQKVFIDGRSDAYEHAGVLQDYLLINSLDQSTRFLLRKYGVQACLIKKNAPLGTLLAALPDWARVYTDDLSALFVRRRGRELAKLARELCPNPTTQQQADPASGAGSALE